MERQYYYYCCLMVVYMLDVCFNISSVVSVLAHTTEYTTYNPEYANNVSALNIV